MKLFFIVSFFVCKAIVVPKPMSMQDLELLEPRNSIFNIFWNAFMHYRWIFTSLFFVVISFLALCVAWGFSKNLDQKEEPDDTEIYLEGRKLCLPEAEILKGKQKYFLSEDFEETHIAINSSENYGEKKDKPQDENSSLVRYQQTLISKMTLQS